MLASPRTIRTFAGPFLPHERAFALARVRLAVSFPEPAGYVVEQRHIARAPAFSFNRSGGPPGGNVHLADFIDTNIELIMNDWVVFARELGVTGHGNDETDLRDSAKEILVAIVADMRVSQPAAAVGRRSRRCKALATSETRRSSSR